ncbi:MAG TPA: L,D-transpeptidase family protein [Defluviitaleaceae bacterium]|nr:L,D-transpeptidase family protein [Defluviitaleaceae bacterium]
MKVLKVFFKLLLVILISFFISMHIWAQEPGQEDNKGQSAISLEECIKEMMNIKNEKLDNNQKSYLEAGEERGYLKGIINRNKDEAVTRAMLSRIIVNFLDIKPIYSKDDLFEDLKAFPDAEYIKGVYAEYLIDGIDEKHFYPNQPVSKNEFKTILERIKKYYQNPNNFKAEMKSQSSPKKEEKIKKLLSMTSYKPPKEKVAPGTSLGVLEKGIAQAFINDYYIPSFSYDNASMIILSDLNYYGFDIIWDETNKKISIIENKNKARSALSEEEIKKREKNYIGKPLLYTNIAVYIGNRKIPCFLADNSTIIYINDLSIFGNLNWDGQNKIITLQTRDTDINDDLGVELVNQKVINYNEETIDLRMTHLWYDEKVKKVHTVEDSVYGIPSGDAIEFSLEKYDLYEKSYYLGTALKSTNKKDNPFYSREVNYLQSQKMIDYTSKLYKDPEEELLSLVKASIIIGTVKKNAGPFAKDEKVEILYAEAGSWYQCRSISTKKEGRVPWGSVSIPPDPPTNTKRLTKEQLEAYVKLKGFTSNTNYFVWTDLDRQMTYVFKKENNEWKLIRNMLCSTGKNITPTPRGFFTIKERGAYFGKGYMCKNWVQIWGDYLYHSVIMDPTGSYVLEGNVLGKRASQGCIRFSLEDSKWFYDTIPRNTTVWIN